MKTRDSFIVITNPEKVKELRVAGFSTYMTEDLGKKKVFLFVKNSGIIKYLKSHFEKSDFLITNKLCF